MTLILTESFEYQPNATKWNLEVSAGIGVTPRTGAQCSDGYSTSASGYKRQLAAGEEHATLIAGAAARNNATWSTTGPFPNLFQFLSDSGATVHVTIKFDDTAGGTVYAYRGTSAGTLLGSATSGHTGDSIWRYAEAKVVLHDSSGSVVVRVDETTVLNLTGIDTKNGGTKTVFDSFYVHGLGGSGVVDDVYLCNGAGSVNNDFLGPVKIEALQPSGNGNTSGMTGSDGNSTDNYLLVDDTFPTFVTADYVEATTGSVKDTYVFGDSTLSTGLTVKAVVVHAYAQKSDAGTRGLDTVSRSGGTEATVTPSTALQNGTYNLIWGAHETKPGGGSWLVSDVNAAEFGIVST